jgi:DNA-binding GntR family transcriptional regulator
VRSGGTGQSLGKRASNGRASADQSLADTAYQRLRQEILTCVLAPGEPLFEGAVAERYGVSKTPIREALNTLRREGLVRVLARRGYQVAPLTLQDVAELFQLRLLVEVGAAELAAERLGPADLDALEALAHVDYTPGSPASLAKFVRANREFHLRVVAATGNGRLVETVARCLDELERVFCLRADLRDITREVEHDHVALVEALRSGDGARAAAVMREQITATHRHIMSTLLDVGSSGLSVGLEIYDGGRVVAPGAGVQG